MLNSPQATTMGLCVTFKKMIVISTTLFRTYEDFHIPFNQFKLERIMMTTWATGLWIDNIAECPCPTLFWVLYCPSSAMNSLLFFSEEVARSLVSSMIILCIVIFNIATFFRRDTWHTDFDYTNIVDIYDIFQNVILHVEIILPILPQPSWNVEQYRLKLSNLVDKGSKRLFWGQSQYLNRYEIKFSWENQQLFWLILP